MATRRDIRDAFYTELENAVSPTVGGDDVTLQGAEDEETLPQVVYNDNYRLVTYNGVGRGPQIVDRDNSGNVNDERWREYIEAQFLIEVRDRDEISKESLYESLRTQFAAYTMPGFGIANDTHPEDLHADVTEVEVRDANSNDALGEDDPIRADSLDVRIEFYREYTMDTIIMDQINVETDADLDSNTSGTTYTVT